MSVLILLTPVSISLELDYSFKQMRGQIALSELRLHWIPGTIY